MSVPPAVAWSNFQEDWEINCVFVGAGGAGASSFLHPAITKKAIEINDRRERICFFILLDYELKNNESLPAIIGYKYPAWLSIFQEIEYRQIIC
jgi:hypothetical protein